ncbi:MULTISPECIES: DsbA family protein [unclassified Meridianimarinicoccus]|uniref:DsbA family protein n=1 Tax=unclassified Meridianimarinicoccus TaxID=2923344 RepID=UPI0018662DB2|nr:DsbA family protein [Fluviibacterium sp. MJW13]
MTTPKLSGNRRGFLALGGAVALLAGAPALWRVFAPSLSAPPHPSVPGFFQLEQAAVTGAFDPLVGLQDGPRIEAAEIPDICAALFRTPRDGRVPLAFFTDINCTYCRTMEPWITALDPATVALTVHDLPLLGAGSVAAARAILAAEYQGASSAMRTRLHRTRFQPDPAYLTALAEGLGLDAPRLLQDMDRPEVTARIATSLGLAARFQIPGTPALVVGSVLAVGNRSKAEVQALIDQADIGVCT